MHAFLQFSIFCLLFFNNCLSSTADRFKQAHNRTFIGFEKEQNSHWTGDFTFIQATDPQFGLTEYVKANWTHVPNWEQEKAQLHQAVAEWNALVPRPSFIVITGDLANAYPTNYTTLRRRQLDDVRAELEQINSEIPLIILSGNHDLEDTPTELTISEYITEFGDDYFSFWKGGVLFIILNTQLYRDPELTQNLLAQQEAWLDGLLKAPENGNATHLIVLQHIPWFLSNISEPFNSIFTFPLDERQRMISKLYQGGVRHIFAGHYHRNAEGKFEDLQMITTSATGWQNNLGGPANAQPGYRLVTVTADTVTHAYLNIGNEGTSAAAISDREFWLFISIIILSSLVYVRF